MHSSHLQIVIITSLFTQSVLQQTPPEFGVALQSGKYRIKWTICPNLPTLTKWANAIVVDDTLYLGGGVGVNFNANCLIFSFKPTDNQWKTLPFLSHCNGFLANVDGRLSYVGGEDFYTEIPTNKVMTLQDDKWITYYPSMIESRSWPVAVSYQHYTVVAGGIDEDQMLLSTTEVFNCHNHQWTTLSVHLPQPMHYINATACNHSFIIVGFTDDNNMRHNEAFMIDIDSLLGMEQQLITQSFDDDNRWIQLPSTPYWNAAIVPNTYPPVIIGGRNKQDKGVNHIFLYDNYWRLVSSLPFNSTSGTVSKISNGIIVTGGHGYGKSEDTVNATILTTVVLGQLELCN